MQQNNLMVPIAWMIIALNSHVELIEREYRELDSVIQNTPMRQPELLEKESQLKQLGMLIGAYKAVISHFESMRGA